MIEELLQKAEEKKAKIDADIHATEREKKAIDMVFRFLAMDDGFDVVPDSTIFAIFTFLGYEFDLRNYKKMIEEATEESHKRYVYVDPEDLRGMAVPEG